MSSVLIPSSSRAPAARQHELVHADAVEGDRQVARDVLLGQPRPQVVGVQHGDLGRLAQALAAERADVGVGAHEHAEVALEAAQLADRLGPVVVELEARARRRCPRAPPAHHLRPRQIRLDAVRHRDRPGARPAAPVGLGERLVQVVVDDVEAHVAGPRDAHHGVEVGPVVVERGPHAVHDRGDLLDVAVEQPERVGVGEHEAGHVVAGLGAQIVDVHAAVLVGADLDDLVAGHRDRGGVGAVRGVGGEHLVAAARRGPRGRRALAAARPARRASPRSAAARRAAAPRSPPARPAGSTSARARPARTRGPAAGAGARARAARPPARAAWGCASSCTSPSG